jgi:VPDSG-CTERM motif
LALISLLGLGITQSARANLITNPGFETGNFTGWTVSGAASVVGTASGISPHSGSFQAAGSVATISQTFATTPGQLYTLDFWAAAVTPPGVMGQGFRVFWDGLNVISTGFGEGNASYLEITHNRTASSAFTNLAFEFDTTGTVFFDDFSVTPVGVPDAGSTFALLSFGLLGVAMLRRKLSC